MDVISALDSFAVAHARFFRRGARLVAACSGGADSMVLAHALCLRAKERGWRVTLAHVNHGLRGRAADRDERLVARQAGAWGVAFGAARLRLLPGPGVEERARAARYAALERMARRKKAPLLLTAHHRDDQVETVLLNLFRGTGTEGLAGMPPLRDLGEGGLRLGRPLLEVSSEEIRSYASRNCLPFSEDSSNRDDRLRRNWLRRRLLPTLTKPFPGATGAIARLAELMRGEERYWEAETRRIAVSVTRRSRAGAVMDGAAIARLPLAVRRRVLRHVVGGDLLTFDGVERLRHWMSRPPTGGRIWTLPGGWSVERLSRSRGAATADLFRVRRPRQ